MHPVSAGLRIGHAHYMGGRKPPPAWAMFLFTWFIFAPIAFVFVVGFAALLLGRAIKRSCIFDNQNREDVKA